MSKGIDLNNPFDLEVSPYFRWQGESIATTGMNGGFCQFDTLADGLRAGLKDIYNAWKHDGFNSIQALVTHYAPPSENDTEAYIVGVCATTGWGRHDPFNLDDPAKLALLGRAMLTQEQGHNYVLALELNSATRGLLDDAARTVIA